MINTDKYSPLLICKECKKAFDIKRGRNYFNCPICYSKNFIRLENEYHILKFVKLIDDILIIASQIKFIMNPNPIIKVKILYCRNISDKIELDIKNIKTFISNQRYPEVISTYQQIKLRFL